MPILNRPLRVMHIISGDLWAGAEAQAFTLLKHLHKKLSLHVILLNEGELSRRLRELQIPISIVPETTFNSLHIVLQLTTLIRDFKPDVIHTHRQKENILGNLANLIASLPFYRRARSVRTTHGAPEFAPKGKQKLQVWMDNWVGKYWQQAIIAVSDDLGEKLKSLFSANKIRIIYNGVDSTALLAAASVAEFRQNAPNHLHIGIIGRIEPVKRIDIFIDMANILLKNNLCNKPFRFHIIGDGGLRSTMKQKVTDLYLDNDIIFHGHRNDMASCINSLDAVVMCSDHEGTPMIALETLALGKPLVAHKVGGLEEILKNLPNLLVHRNRPIEYSDKLLQLFTTAPIQGHLDERYKATTNATSTIALYENLLIK